MSISAPSIRALARRLLGRPADWRLSPPALRAPRPGLHWLGPLAVLASVLISWFAFRGAGGEDGSVAFGLFIGAASILLMAWSFILAVRIRVLEPLFGGLDRMYRVHRWAGALAIGAMFLHTRAEPEIEGGIRGASEGVADMATSLAGNAEMALYALVGLSVIRWFPYRWWRWTHKLLGIPFALASWHFVTAEKTYDNVSAWGVYFGGFMVAGLVAYLVRVVGRDMLRRGRRYRVEGAEVVGSSLDLRLAPVGRPLRFRAGQFAVLKVQRPGLREPHIFTIASAPEGGGLRFFIRRLGDWTGRLHDADLRGAEVRVEGPYGRFAPTGNGTPTVWVAGGVGITPFLAASADLPVAAEGRRPVLFYCVSRSEDAMALDVLERAQREGRLELHLLASREGRRFGRATLRERFGSDGLRGAHVAVCGPARLVASVERAARRLGARHVEREDFDIRQGVGPDLPGPDLRPLRGGSRAPAADGRRPEDPASARRWVPSGGRRS